VRSLNDHAAFGHLYFLAVYFKFNHDGQSSLTCYRSIVRPLAASLPAKQRRPRVLPLYAATVSETAAAPA
jgi:hypothetical protein